MSAAQDDQRPPADPGAEGTASEVLGRLREMPQPARPKEWPDYAEAMVRWADLATAAELRDGADEVVRRLLDPGPPSAPDRFVTRLLQAAAAGPAVAADPDSLLSSALLGAEMRARVPAPALKRILAGLVQRVLGHGGAEVSPRRFFQLLAWLAELPKARAASLAGAGRRYVRQRLAGMEATEGTEWLLDLPGELAFAPRWPEFRRRLLVDALRRQADPIVLRAPTRITRSDMASLPASLTERVLAGLLARGRQEEAVPWAEQATHRSGSARHYRVWGQALLGAGETEAAASVLERAVDRYPANGPLRMDWAKVEARLGRYAEIVQQGDGRDAERRALARNLAATALAPRGGADAMGDERSSPPTLEDLRRRLGIAELVREEDTASFRAELGLPPIRVAPGAEGSAGEGAGLDPRWLMLGYETHNIGDEVQGIAAARFLPRIDGLLDRDDLTALSEGTPARAILNGWYMEPGLDGRYRWPPHAGLDGLWVSMHIDPVHAPGLLTPTGIDYLRSTGGPIGCRDLFTRDLLRSVGVEAEFTGCMTLTLPRSERRRRRVVCFSDLGAELEEALRPVVKRQLGIEPSRIAHLVGRGSLENAYETRVEAALELLAVYASASLVVTTRLHAALPCQAMGTPVVMVVTDPTDLRFGGVLDAVPTLSHADCVEVPERALELAHRPAALPDWVAALRARVEAFVG